MIIITMISGLTSGMISIYTISGMIGYDIRVDPYIGPDISNDT